MKPRHTRAWSLGLAALALLAVFWAYVQPEFVLTAANWVWNCF